MDKASFTRWHTARRITASIFLLPALFLIVVFVLIPETSTIMLSFFEWRGIGAFKFSALSNFTRLFKDSVFIKSLYRTLMIAGVSSVISLLLGLILAFCMQIIRIREGIIYRTIIFIPVILPLTIVGLLFRFVFDFETGILNQLFRSIGLKDLVRAWLSDKRYALWALSFVEIWKNVGLPMMLIYAGLVRIPDTLYEAAKIDGANYLQTAIMISLPISKVVIRTTLVYLIILCFKTYDLIYIMTKGGPGRITTTIPIWMVETAYMFNDFGYAASMAVVLALVMTIMVLASSVTLRGEKLEY